jgi:hypothetical protein
LIARFLGLATQTEDFRGLSGLDGLRGSIRALVRFLSPGPFFLGNYLGMLQARAELY